MQSAAAKSSNLPYKCRMVCVSLVGGSTLLVLIYIILYLGFISIEAAMWAWGGVFVAAAIYETCLMSIITRHMLNRVSNKSKEP